MIKKLAAVPITSTVEGRLLSDLESIIKVATSCRNRLRQDLSKPLDCTVRARLDWLEQTDDHLSSALLGLSEMERSFDNE